MNEKGMYPMGRVYADFIKARRWRLLADLADREVLTAGLVGLGTIAMMFFVAKSIFGMFGMLAAGLKSVF
jgi:hypothetical protein